MTPENAQHSAYKILDLSVTKQAAVLSYMDVFLYLGVIFLICIPFILFIKERKSKQKAGFKRSDALNQTTSEFSEVV
jgi:hypothetical protein